MSGLRTIQKSDGVHVILPRRFIISGPLKTLFWGAAMIIVPVLAPGWVHAAAPRLDDFHSIIVAAGFPFEGFGVLFVLVATFGLMPLSYKACVTADWLIWDRWNGPIRSRKRWPRSAITGFEVVPDHRRDKASVRIKGNFDEAPEIAIGSPAAVISELAAELTQICECGSAG
jgi:hypothetical protein